MSAIDRLVGVAYVAAGMTDASKDRQAPAAAGATAGAAAADPGSQNASMQQSAAAGQPPAAAQPGKKAGKGAKKKKAPKDDSAPKRPRGRPRKYPLPPDWQKGVRPAAPRPSLPAGLAGAHGPYLPTSAALPAAWQQPNAAAGAGQAHQQPPLTYAELRPHIMSVLRNTMRGTAGAAAGGAGLDVPLAQEQACTRPFMGHLAVQCAWGGRMLA